MLNRIFESTVKAYPARQALVFGAERYTYAELHDRVMQCAAGLARLGAQPGDTVAVLLKNSPEFVFTFLAAAQLGAPTLLLDPGSKPAELRRIFQQQPVAAAVCEAEHVACLEELRPMSRHAFRLIARGRNFSDLLGAAEPLPAPREWQNEIAIIQYSSGSTGWPKCIARSHANLFWEAKDFHETTGVCADDRIFCTTPLFHAHALGNALLAALYAGATLFIAEDFNRWMFMDLIVHERITVLPSVPFIFDLLARYVRSEGSKPGNSLRLVFSAGAPLSPEISREFHEQFGIYVRQLYGSTELGSATINLEPDIESTLESVGHPMKNVRIEIFREDGAPATTDEVGEVAIQSPAMPEGYFGQPDLTRQKFRLGFYWSGDLGKRDSRGLLSLQGRAPWVVSSSGRKVDPLEVEAVIATYPKVKEVVVVGVPGSFGEPVVKAVVVPREKCQEQEIVGYCRDKLADFKIPRLVQFVSKIPRSVSGKILRKELLL